MAKVARRETTRATFWRRLIARQAASGMTIRAWCRKHSVQEAAFYWWRRRLARQDAEAREPAFVPVSVRGGTEDSLADAAPEIEILLADNQRVRLRGPVNRQILADVLAVLTTRGGEAESRAC